MAAIGTRQKAPRGRPRGSGVSSQLKASLGNIQEFIASVEAERRERAALVAENQRLRAVIARIESALGVQTAGTVATVPPTGPKGAQRKVRRKRKPLSAEARERAAANLAKARAVRMANLKAKR